MSGSLSDWMGSTSWVRYSLVYCKPPVSRCAPVYIYSSTVLEYKFKGLVLCLTSLSSSTSQRKILYFLLPSICLTASVTSYFLILFSYISCSVKIIIHLQIGEFRIWFSFFNEPHGLRKFSSFFISLGLAGKRNVTVNYLYVMLSPYCIIINHRTCVPVWLFVLKDPNMFLSPPHLNRNTLPFLFCPWCTLMMLTRT